MSASVAYLPVWKKGATAAERFQELALMAEKHPEYFEKLVVLYVETMPGPTPRGLTQLRYIDAGCSTYDFIGICQDAILSMWKATRCE